MNIGTIGADVTGSIISGDGSGTGPFAGGCIVGALDANGDTIVSCGWDGTPVTTGQMIPNAPTCAAGDQLSFQGGNWMCIPGAQQAALGLSPAVIYGAMALAAVLFITAVKR